MAFANRFVAGDVGVGIDGTLWRTTSARASAKRLFWFQPPPWKIQSCGKSTKSTSAARPGARIGDFILRGRSGASSPVTRGLRESAS